MAYYLLTVEQSRTSPLGAPPASAIAAS